MTDIHNFDAETGAYLSTIKARLDPLDRKPMVPANATLSAPPETAVLEIAVWSGIDWSVVPDHRGKEYWLPDGSFHRIENLNQTPPDEALTMKPEPSIEKRRADAVLSREDFAEQTAEANIITWSEAADWAAGNALPGIVQRLVEGVPEAEQGRLAFRLLTTKAVSRLAPEVLALGAMLELSEEQIDALFGL